MSRNYVVKSDNGLQYVRAASRVGDALPWKIDGWTTCQRCAARFTRDEAHAVAHGDGKLHVVIQIKTAPAGRNARDGERRAR